MLRHLGRLPPGAGPRGFRTRTRRGFEKRRAEIRFREQTLISAMLSGHICTRICLLCEKNAKLFSFAGTGSYCIRYHE
jgi:hypothetical protein